MRIRAIQEPVFSVANTDFEDGDDDHGYGDCIFLVIYAQPSHKSLDLLRALWLFGSALVRRFLGSLRLLSRFRATGAHARASWRFLRP